MPLITAKKNRETLQEIFIQTAQKGFLPEALFAGNQFHGLFFTMKLCNIKLVA